MKRTKSILAMLMCLMMVFSLLAACGDSDDTPSGNGGGGSDVSDNGGDGGSGNDEPRILTIGVELEAATLDPMISGDLGFCMMASGVMEQLWWLDDEGNLVYGLGTGYEYNDDLTELTIYLREGVTFHNGNEWTADDLLYNLGRAAASPQYAQRVSGIDLENSYTRDDYTAVLKISSFEASFAYSLSAPIYFMLDKEWCEDVGEEGIGMNTNGTGPYILKEWNVGTSYVLTRNDNYWGETPYYDEIVIMCFAESSTRMMEFEIGTLDVVYVTAVQEVNNLQNGYYEDATNLMAPLQSAAGFVFNMRDRADMWPIELRQAIAHAIDSATIVSAVCGGMYNVASSVEPSANWAYLNTGTYEFNPDLSRQILEDAGISDFSFTVQTSASGYNVPILEAIQAQLADVGITMGIDTVDATVYRTMMVAGETVAGLAATMGGGDPGDVLIPREAGSGNSLLETSGALNDLIMAAKGESDKATRLQMYYEIQEYYHDNYLLIPIYEQTYNYGIKDYVVGFQDAINCIATPVLKAIVG